MVFPVNAANQMAAFKTSRTGTSHAGEINFRSGVKRRCKSCATQIRMSKRKNAASKGQIDFAANAEEASHNSGQSEALASRLKKYGTGWQTRMVRAQRN